MSLLIERYSEKLVKLCAVYGVKRLELFGSALRSDFAPEDSDLDFLVEFANAHPLGVFEQYFGLKEELEQLFGRSVDLVEMNAIKNPYFRQAVEQNKILIYGA